MRCYVLTVTIVDLYRLEYYSELIVSSYFVQEVGYKEKGYSSKCNSLKVIQE